MRLSQAARILNIEITGNDVEFQGVSTDTRTLMPNNLFIALKGPHFDGHQFLSIAEEKKAAAVIVEKITSSKLPQLQVPNTLKALGELAKAHRKQFSIPIIGITGSCGKTTTKAMVANILQGHGNTLFSESSFNNEIGTPLTLLRLCEKHEYAVIEMGANHLKEIAYLTDLTQPSVAIITNAAPAHLEGFGSLDGVCQGKGEIFQGLPESGTAILNADDVYLPNWEKMAAPHKILRFSLSKPVDFFAKDIHPGEDGKPCFTLVTPLGEVSIKLPLLGEHNILNALAAAAAAYAIGTPLALIKIGLESVSPVNKRLNEYTTPNGIQLIDDTYNANPASTKIAIQILAQRVGKKILVLGDMKELGKNAESYHHEIGKHAQQLGIDRLYTYGDLSQLTTAAFGQHAKHFVDQKELIEVLKTTLQQNTTVLIKGSKSMQMWHITEALRKTNV